uniref:glycosyltransferase n=1 Tax=Lacrimispora sp. TaxID=2719234 RepID=UPI0032E4CF26
MNRYKICVYAISKNEEQFVDRWMDAVSEADEVIVTDTGSTDGTVEKLRARGATVYEETISPWRFDTARNIALDHVPEDADICVSNDLDEVFIPGWRKILESAWK